MGSAADQDHKSLSKRPRAGTGPLLGKLNGQCPCHVTQQGAEVFGASRFVSFQSRWFGAPSASSLPTEVIRGALANATNMLEWRAGRALKSSCRPRVAPCSDGTLRGVLRRSTVELPDPCAAPEESRRSAVCVAPETSRRNAVAMRRDLAHPRRAEVPQVALRPRVEHLHQMQILELRSKLNTFTCVQ